MSRITWPLVAAGLLVLVVYIQFFPRPIRTPSQEIQRTSHRAELPAPRDSGTPRAYTAVSSRDVSPTTQTVPSCKKEDVETVENKVVQVEQKLLQALRSASQYPAEGKDSESNWAPEASAPKSDSKPKPGDPPPPPPTVDSDPPLPPPVSKGLDVPPPTEGAGSAYPKPVIPAPPPVTPPLVQDPNRAASPPLPKPSVEGFTPPLQSPIPTIPVKPLNGPSGSPTARTTESTLSAKQITSPWTFHLEIVDGRNLVTARVGKTIQFRVTCDKVDMQSPHGTIQAAGNVKIASQGLEAVTDKMTISLSEDSLLLEGKAQLKCTRDDQEMDLRSDRFSLRLSEIQTPDPTTSNLQRPPSVRFSRHGIDQ